MLSRYSWVASDRVSMAEILAKRSSLSLDEHLAPADGDRERVDALGGGQRQRRAGAHVEVGAVAGALDAEAVAVALAERAVIVAAAVLDGVIGTVDQVDA